MSPLALHLPGPGTEKESDLPPPALPSGKCVHSMVAHLDAVTCLAVDPNGVFLMSGSKWRPSRLLRNKGVCRAGHGPGEGSGAPRGSGAGAGSFSAGWHGCSMVTAQHCTLRAAAGAPPPRLIS